MKLITVALASLLLGSVWQTAQGKYEVYGQGNGSCGEWTEKNRAQRDPYLRIWVAGFVSGAGFMSAKPLRETDVPAIGAWMDKYCADNPLDKISTAAGKLVLELERPRLAAHSN